MEEAQVIALVRSGEVDAFAEIIEHYQSPIARYLFRMTGDRELANDLAQETFIKAYKGIVKTADDISFKAWLYRIATNQALQHNRRKRLLSFIPFIAEKHGDAVKSRDDTGAKMEVREAMLKVPEEQRTCLVLHFVEGFKYREIADTLGCSEEAVRKRVARGKKAFIALYERGG